jgi:hypothetical protein
MLAIASLIDEFFCVILMGVLVASREIGFEGVHSVKRGSRWLSDWDGPANA